MTLFVNVAGFTASGEVQRKRARLESNAEVVSGSVNMPWTDLAGKVLVKFNTPGKI